MRAVGFQGLLSRTLRVYAGVRGGLEIADQRVMPVTLDVTDAAQIARAAQEIASLDVLINNAGILLFTTILATPRSPSDIWRSTYTGR